jgi:ferric-dicitrate binding protein FerR (iron transport regulator)
MTLPDGSVVRFNAKSKVSCAEGFAKRREVSLTGEAYFEVTHNEQLLKSSKTNQDYEN